MTTQTRSTQSTRRGWLTACTVCLGFFLGMLDTTAANFALPDISSGFRVGIPTLQWVIDGYNIAFAAILLAGGTLGDSLGRRRMFQCGVLIFLAGSVVCAAAPGPTALILGRVLQGTGSGLLLPQSVTLLALAFPDDRRRNAALAVWSVVGGVGLAAGPSLGGAMIELLGWRSLFILNVPICVVTLALTRIYVTDTTVGRRGTLDLRGQILGTACLAGMAIMIVEYHWFDEKPTAWAVTLAITVLAGITLARHVRTAPAPVIPHGIFRQGHLASASLGAACMTFGMYGMFMLIPVTFVAVRDTTILGAGVLMLPIPLAYIALSPVAARLATRHGPKMPMLLGTTAMGLGMIVLAVVGPGRGPRLLIAVFTLIGVGLGLNTGPVMGLAVSSITPDLLGAASGIANTARMMGASLGVAAEGATLHHFVQSGDSPSAYATGFRAALIVGGAAEFVGLIIAIRHAPHWLRAK